jgi:hypothetical protein
MPSLLWLSARPPAKQLARARIYLADLNLSGNALIGMGPAKVGENDHHRIRIIKNQ